MVCDGAIANDLPERRPVPFDRLSSWEERSRSEHRIVQLLAAIAAHPAVAAIGDSGFSLIDFAEYRLRLETARLLSGWTVARAGAEAGARRAICDPALPAAFAMGVRAGLGLDPAAGAYTIPSALPGSPGRRAMARQLMRLLAAGSRPRRARSRVAAVAAGKLAIALTALSDADLAQAGVGLMPFPGLDHGNSLLLCMRRRLPLVSAYSPLRAGSGAAVRLPANLGLVADAGLDRALTLLVARVMAGTADELSQAVRTLAGLARAPGLRAVLLPSAAYGASRLLIDWAHRRDLRVGVVQHGVYGLREFDGGDSRADVIFAWGEAVVEQIQSLFGPRPLVRPVGVPGMAQARAERSADAGTEGPAGSGGVAGTPVLRRALIATTSTIDAPLMPSAFCEDFIEALAPGLHRLAGAGVEIELRPHPTEDPEYYRRLLSARELDVEVVDQGTVAQAVAGVDIVISSVSSVAFEAAAAGRPVLLWLGAAPRWVREEHMVAPWIGGVPGMFEASEDFDALACDLLEHPAAGFRAAYELRRYLAGFAEPFDAAQFAAELRELAA
jgi:hypothetical protein